MKDKPEIKGKLNRWTLDSARWYEEAYLFSDYHKILADKIFAAVSADASCCELACGNGSLARSVAPGVRSYTANDIDLNAIEWVKQKKEEESHNNMEIVAGDWKTVISGRRFDAVIFSFFGAVLNDWDKLKEITRDKVIIIVPRERKNVIPNRFNKGHSPETYEKIISFFDAEGVAYKAEPLDLEFGQPFYNMKDALEYVEYYYSITGEDAQKFVEDKFEKTDYGWYFPKLKRIGFIVAEI